MMWYLWEKDGMYSISNYKPDEPVTIFMKSEDKEALIKKMIELTRSNETVQDFENSLMEQNGE